MSNKKKEISYKKYLFYHDYLYLIVIIQKNYPKCTKCILPLHSLATFETVDLSV